MIDNFATIAPAAVLYITICTEMDIHVLASTQMIELLEVAKNKI